MLLNIQFFKITQMWSQFLFEDHDNALDLDALKSSHPIAVDVVNPAQIGEIFDAISYSKVTTIV